MAVPIPPKPRSEKIWFDGDLVNWNDARVHLLSHVLHYGSSVFEGIRCYQTESGSGIFRLREHVERLFFSARVLRMEIPYSVDELLQACVDSVEVSGLPECYIRPLVFRGAGEMGVLPRNCPVHTAIAVWPWGAYLGAEGLTEGVDVMVSSWQRVAPNTIPAMAKIGGAYVLSQLAKMEAVRYGYVEAIMLDADGRISEGTGENVFVVLDGRIMTPPLSSSILGGITRNSVITLAKERGYDFVEQTLNREILYMAQEVFMTGTAAEVTPIRSVDRLPVGTGKPGPVTMALQEDFFDLVRGKVADRHRWLTPVAPAAVPAD